MADIPSGHCWLSLLVVLLKLLKTERLGSEGVRFPLPLHSGQVPELGSAEGQQRKRKDKIPTPPHPTRTRRSVFRMPGPGSHFTGGAPWSPGPVICPEQQGWRGQVVGWREWVSDVQAPVLGPKLKGVRGHVGLGPAACCPDLFPETEERKRWGGAVSL